MMSKNIKSPYIPAFLRAGIILCICVLGCVQLKAQSAYHGGKGDGFAWADLQAVYVSVEETTGQSAFISLYPSPLKSGEVLHVQFPAEGNYRLTITDMAGRPVTRTTLNYPTQTSLPALWLQPGTYLLHVQYGEREYSSLLIII